MKETSKRADYRVIVTVILTAFMAAIFGACFWQSFARFGEAVRDLFLAYVGAFCAVFKIKHNFNACTVDNASSVLTIQSIINEASIEAKFKAFGQNFISGENFVEYIVFIFRNYKVGIILLFVLSFVAVMIGIYIVANKRIYNNDYGFESKPLKLYKKIERKVFYPCYVIIKDYIDYVRAHRAIILTWCLIVAFSLNLPTVVIEGVAFFFSILVKVTSADFFMQLSKLLADLSVLGKIPLIIWTALAVAIFFAWRKRVAERRLRNLERDNERFVKSLSSVIVFAGLMRAGKDRTQADMMLSTHKIFRMQALEIMQEIDALFPNIDWQLLENVIIRQTKTHEIYNLVTCEVFANKIITILRYIEDGNEMKFRRYVRNRKITDYAFLSSYDYQTYGLYKDNGYKREFLGDCIKDYIKAYFIYSSETSLLFSNYAVKEKWSMQSEGNFPVWIDNFFKEIGEPTSHILDMDMFRLHKKVKKNNVNANAFEFGVVGMTELDKERGNKNDTQELKKFTKETNAKNDNFNGYMKMSGHVANIRGRNFVKFFANMQRFESINADFLGIGDLLMIESASETSLLMPGFTIGELLYDIFVPTFKDYYVDRRYRRADNTLAFYLLKKVCFGISGHYTKAYNHYGVIVEMIKVNDDEKPKQYYIMPRKIYSDVYSTDAMASFFRMKNAKSAVGINDIKTFSGIRATADELAEMNSYMVNSWLENLEDRDDEGSKTA